MNKREVDTIDATPSKRIYRSIIADYGLNTAISELIDNAIDATWEDKTWKQSLEVDITINLAQRNILLKDTAGGVRESELKKLISPGETSLMGDTASIGIFGVGSKRAVVALAEIIQITTRYHHKRTFLLEYDDAWLRDPDWNLPVYSVPDIGPGTTEIKLSNLRFAIEEDDIVKLRRHLERTYAIFLREKNIVLRLNGTELVPAFFNQWAFPPDYPPQGFYKWLPVGRGKRNVRFQITGGLTLEGGSIGGEYGVYFYCNNRLIARAVRNASVGFASGIAGVPHPRMSLARVIIELHGPSSEMPWTSNKTSINYTHSVFRAVQKDVIQMVKIFTGLSKSLQQDFDEKIAPYHQGTVEIKKLPPTQTIRPSYLPKIPPRVPNYQDEVLELNRSLADAKPWVRGLYEGILAFVVVEKQMRLEQRNRILLIILDSTLEIAFKEYLANEIPNPLGDEKLSQLFNNRQTVHAEMEKYVLPGDQIWTRIKYFYRLRCDLIHKRANAGLSDETIESFRKDVIKILSKAFKIRFPQRD